MVKFKVGQVGSNRREPIEIRDKSANQGPTRYNPVPPVDGLVVGVGVG